MTKIKTYKMMRYFGYILLSAISFITFSSCSLLYKQEKEPSHVSTLSIPANSYGTYLAGRIAHYRQDFNAAANFYMKTIQKDTKNKALLNKTYLILASQGYIEKAAYYAQIAAEQGDKNDFIAILIAANEIKQKNYDTALKVIRSNKSELYKKLITPFVEAWIYTGLNQYENALASLDPIKNQNGMEALFHFHSGMINDYFNKTDEAQKHYESIINNKNFELSIRTLEIICNFYIRNGRKEDAVKLSGKYANITPNVSILQNIHNNIIKSTPKISPLISSPQIGLSEAMFNIAAIIKYNSDILDFSHIFIRMAIFENPQNDLARILLANILEMREMYKDAIKVYDEIQISSPSYYVAQYKKAENLRNLNDYKGAELLLKSLILDYPNDYQTKLDLGDILRLQEKYKEALKYYNQVITDYSNVSKNLWQVYYAAGITYERLGNWKEAEKNLVKALSISPNNLLVLNYLGYTWLNQGKKPEDAFLFIVKAYNQAPYNSSIIDSLGWAFYQFGMYDDAISYLEKASENDPSNAVISAHLGDAYWQNNRKNEATFQWNHALSQKDVAGELNIKDIKKKIANGMSPHTIIPHDQEKINKIISKIKVAK